MKLKFRNEGELTISASPDSYEPYDGFFAVNGIEDCNHVTCVTDFFNSNINSALEEAILEVFPIISSGHYLFVDNKNKCLTYPSAPKQKDEDNYVRVINLVEAYERVEDGENLKAVLQPTIDALTKADRPYWLGYIVEIRTGSSSQILTLHEDFNTATKIAKDFTKYAKKTAREVYASLSDKKVSSFLKQLPKLYNEYGTILFKAFETAIARAQEKDLAVVQKTLTEPINNWLSKYERALSKTGIPAVEETFVKKIIDHCINNRLTIFLPCAESETGFRRDCLLKSLEDFD